MYFIQLNLVLNNFLVLGDLFSLNFFSWCFSLPVLPRLSSEFWEEVTVFSQSFPTAPLLFSRIGGFPLIMVRRGVDAEGRFSHILVHLGPFGFVRGWTW